VEIREKLDLVIQCVPSLDTENLLKSKNSVKKGFRCMHGWLAWYLVQFPTLTLF
jgi:hypothetical protein